MSELRCTLGAGNKLPNECRSGWPVLGVLQQKPLDFQKNKG